MLFQVFSMLKKLGKATLGGLLAVVHAGKEYKYLEVTLESSLSSQALPGEEVCVAGVAVSSCPSRPAAWGGCFAIKRPKPEA